MKNNTNNNRKIEERFMLIDNKGAAGGRRGKLKKEYINSDKENIYAMYKRSLNTLFYNTNFKGTTKTIILK